MIIIVVKNGHPFAFSLFFSLRNELNLDFHLGRTRDKSALVWLLKKDISLGAPGWLSVKHPTIDFGSGHDLMFVSLSPASALH